MKKLLVLIFIVICFKAFTQPYPNIPPTVKADSGRYEIGYVRPIVLGHFVEGDTLIRARYNGATRLWFHSGVDTAIWAWHTNQWFKIASGGGGGGGGGTDTINLSFRIDTLAAKTLGVQLPLDTIRLGNDTTVIICPTCLVPADTLNISYRIDTISFNVAPFLQNGLIIPGYVTWIDSLKFEVTAATYRIGGVQYVSDLDSVTLSAADPTLDRIDVIYVDINGNVGVLTGTPSATPSAPQVDPATQLQLTTISIPAGATIPGGATQTIIYDENLGTPTEWSVASGGGWGFTSNDNTTPYHLIKDISTNAWVANQTIVFLSGSSYVSTDYTTLKAAVYLKATIPSTSNIIVGFYNGATLVSNFVTLGPINNFFQTTTGYQNLTIPISSFTFSSTTFTNIKFTFTNSGSGIFMDYVQLLGGIPTGSSPYITDVFRPAGSTQVYKVINGLALPAFIDSTGGASARFGIEDNTGIQDRYINMQNFILNIDSVKEVDMTAYGPTQSAYFILDSSHANFSSGMSQLTLQNNIDAPSSQISTTDVDNIQTSSFWTYPSFFKFDNTIGVAKIFLPFSNDLDVPSPTRIAVWDNDTLKSADISVIGGGSVSSFSSGNLSPIFTTSVATATTTPALSFALSNATAWQTLARHAGTTGAPSYGQLKAEHLNTTYSNGNMLITDGSGNLSWTTASSGITALTGDVTASGSGSVAATLATVNSNVGSFTNANITVNGKGLITAASNGTGGAGTVTSVAATAASGMTVTGSPVTTSGTLAFAWTGAVQGDLPYFNGTNTLAFLNKDANATRYLSNQGTSNNPSWNQINLANGVTGALPIANGGTNNASLSVTQGTVYYGDGTKLVGLAPGTSGYVLRTSGAAANPIWANPSDSLTIRKQGSNLQHIVSYNSFGGGTAGGTSSDSSNIIIGLNSGNNSMTGYYNFSYGTSTLRANTSGFANLAMGYNALRLNTTGNYNTALGIRALNANTTGSGNIALGTGQFAVSDPNYATLGQNTTGSNNIAMGDGSMRTNTTGSANIAIGRSTMTNAANNSNTSVVIGDGAAAGSSLIGSSVAVGVEAGQRLGIANVYMGYRAGGNIVGLGNIVLGYQANAYTDTSDYLFRAGYEAGRTAIRSSRQFALGAYSLTQSGGADNLAMGYASGLNAGSTGIGAGLNNDTTIGTQNVLVGNYTFNTQRRGTGNTVLGYGSMDGSFGGATTRFTGNYNLVLGNRAEQLKSAGNDNITLGHLMNSPDVTGSNQLTIGSNNVDWISKGTGNNFRVNATGALVTTFTPSAALEVSSTDKGLLIPTLTTTQRNSISSPATGLVIFNSTTNTYDIYDGTRWEVMPNGLAGSASLDFGSVASLGNASLTITVTGAADSDPVYIGTPNGSMTAGLIFNAWVSAANTVSVQVYNSTLGAIDPASGTFKVFVKKN